MGNFLEEGKPGVMDVTPSPPEAKRQRRCVQSKLSWGPPKGGDAIVPLEVEDSEEEKSSEEESKGKGKRKGKTKARAPRKSPVTRKESPAISTRRKSPLKSPGNNSCKKLKNNQSGDASKLDVMKDLDDPFTCQKKPTSIINLWTEAKLAGEENMRLSAGKQIHPFFACRKEAKRISESQDDKLERGKQWTGYDRDIAISYPLFHIFDKEADDNPLDWSNWNFMERTLDLNGSCAAESSLADCGGLVEPLRFHTVSLREMHADQLSIVAENNSATTASIVEDNGQCQKQLPSSYSEFHLSSAVSFLSRCSSWMGNLEISHQDGLHKERLLSYYGRSNYWPECSLWTTKYQPENASEVCGNYRSVRQLNEWLKSWQEKGQKRVEKFNVEEYCAVEVTDDSLYETESDTDQEDASNLRNVLLITGPVGSGKSAAIYACAKEQGFEVIEVSASDLRNGANIKSKFAEAMESHGFNRWFVNILLECIFNFLSSYPTGFAFRSFDNNTISRRKQNLDVLPGTPGTTESLKLEKFGIGAPTVIQDSGPSRCSWDGGNRVANKSLILFEDVDTVFDEDHGFISSILHLAETAKRPIILTSNSKDPVLPPLLDKLVLDFEPPSFEELFRHVHMICASEKVQISAHLLQQLIRSSLGDLRKIIMLLQFWCQGKNQCIGRYLHTCSPLCFDLDAAHLVIPIAIPWGFQCELSEKVVDEISRTISSIEGNSMLLELNPIEKDGSSELGKMPKFFNKKRKCKLSKKRSDSDSAEFLTNDKDLNDFSDASESIARFNQQRTKRRPCLVLSSQSGDTSSADELQAAEVLSADTNDRQLPYMPALPISQITRVPSPLKPQADSTYHSGRDNAVQDLLENPETASASHVCDTFKELEVSCVPESSFVAGFEVIDRDDVTCMEVYSNIITASIADSVQLRHASPKEVNNLDRAISEINLCLMSNINEVVSESGHDNEGLGYSLNGVEELPVSGYQFMDECSRADFSIGLVPQQYGERSSGNFSVHETWKKLRNQREQLKSYLSKNQRETSIVNLTAGLTDLISETDIMFSGCNPLISDVLEPSLTPSAEPDDFSWYDEQYEMGSTYSQHGLCLYLKECGKTCQDIGFIETGVLMQEMLASSNNAMALGKLLSLESTNTDATPQGGLHSKEARYCIPSGRKSQSVLLDALLPLVPARVSMTLRGSGFQDYLSFTSCISKFESERVSKSMKENGRRRSRSSKNYLSSGSLLLSPKDVELLARASCFKEAAPLVDCTFNRWQHC
ncbi:hypothetical protein Cni_G02112 [Canna indica]|uniref:AAA+ ATPase domain-containing protein n=1 Tax=Canna indica TaxID=4628 RepID=A0AAQ3Q1V5_9LILI|nr:hypothetical protein Cni_G02112 [Canna indica]